MLVPLGGLPHRVVVEAFSAAGDERTRTWRSAAPFTEAELAERIRWQLRAWVESGGIPGGITRIRLVPADLSDQGRQLRLGQDATSEEEARRAIIRAQGLVGPDAVLQAGRQGGREPGSRCAGIDGAKRPPPLNAIRRRRGPVASPRPSPTLVPPEPASLDVDWMVAFPPGCGSAADGYPSSVGQGHGVPPGAGGTAKLLQTASRSSPPQAHSSARSVKRRAG